MRFRNRSWLAGSALVPALALVTVPAIAHAQGVRELASGAGTSAAMAVPVPFGPGESMTYQVKVGLFGNVGSGTINIEEDLATVRGRPTYVLNMRLKGGPPLLKVDDLYRSWLDIEKIQSHRFHQNLNEVRYKRNRTLDFFPEERKWIRPEKPVDNGIMPTDKPLDDLSFLYFVRTLPLEIGKTYTLNRYFKENGNPVTVKVLRREQVTVPAGTFQTIVVQPLIKTDGLFGDDGQAEVYFTDDDRRIPVQIKSKVKILKYMNMYLQSYTPGDRLAPGFNPKAGV